MSVPSTILGRIFIRKSAAVAGYTLLVYDYLLTLPLELEYIWDAKWTIIKTLFLTVRYWSLIGQTIILLEEMGYLSHNSKRFCGAFTLYRPFYIILCGEGIRLMVVMRTCAIAGCKRYVATTWNILYTLFALSILGVVLYFFIRVGPPNFEYLNETGICFSPAPTHLWTILLAVMIFDSFIVIVVCRNLRRLTETFPDVYHSRLVRLLARDALLFYMATMFNSLFCIACWTIWAVVGITSFALTTISDDTSKKHKKDPRNTLQEWISVPLLVVMGERLILNLRQLRAKPDSTRDLSREVQRQIAAMGVHEDTQSDMVIELRQFKGRRVEI